MRILMIAVACALIAACTTTDTRVVEGIEAAPSGSRVLLVKPDVSLSILTAAGQLEPRDDWTKTAGANISREVGEVLQGRSHTYSAFDPDAAMGGRGGQILRLNEAVGAQIALSEYGPYKLPSKTKGEFNWTLGDGAAEIGRQANADYALFILARGSYASGGRVATAVGLSLLGVSLPMGSQSAQASLVDLKTGRVVWFNVLIAGSGASDIREDDGAEQIIKKLLKDVPL